MVCGSRPALTPNTSASATATVLTWTSMLLTSFMASPLPSGPTWKLWLPMAANRSVHFSNTSRAPPAITESSPDCARPVPPLTGASIMATSTAARRSAMLWAVKGSMVDMQTTMWPGRAPRMMPWAPMITASACSVVSTMTMMRSAAAATACAEPATSAPLAFKGRLLASSMSLTTSEKPALTRLSAIGPPMAPSPMNPNLPGMECSLLSARQALYAARHVDGEAGDEIGVGRGKEADDAGLVDGLGDSAQWRAFDLLGLGGLRALLPLRPDALGQGDAGRDGVDVNAFGAELVRKLAGEGDDAPLGRGVGARAVRTEAAAGDRGQVDDLATALALHQGNDGMGAEKRAVEVEGDQLLPVGEAQFFGGGVGLGNDSAAAHGIDQNVDLALLADGVRDQLVDLRRIERVDQCRLHFAARTCRRCAQRRHGFVEPAPVVVGRNHRCALAHHDLRRSTANAVGGCGDQHNLVLEAHGQAALAALAGPQALRIGSTSLAKS